MKTSTSEWDLGAFVPSCEMHSCAIRYIVFIIVLLLVASVKAQSPEVPSKALRDDGTYQNGGYWATPLPWLMETLTRVDPARAAVAFCEAVEDFQARKDINEWVNNNAPRPRGIRDYCASASMPLAGAKRLRAKLAATGRQLPPELAKRFNAAETWLRDQAKRVLRGSSSVGKDGVCASSRRTPPAVTVPSGCATGVT